MFGTSNDLILQLGSQVIEIIAVPCNPDDKVLVLFRMFLGIPQDLCRNHVELDVMPVHPEVAADQPGYLANAAVVPEKIRCKFLI